QLFDTGASMKIEANGYIGGVQMTLKHGENFSIDLTDEAMDVSDYRTVGNETILVIVEPVSDELFTYSGKFEIVDMIVVNSKGRVNVIEPIEFKLNSAYPNPFNPSTTINYTLANQANIDLSVFNISGQLIENLKNAYQDAGNYEIVWDASQQPSGIYLLRLQSEHESFNQKLMLMK
ncbi:MAG: T9SS type A sorting domain-containing protein, partial [Candidatus Marinimicrobia bacterium]|nr:T9SS type A sorting domain-containing protein [Candidatus Neomarinimicrobiota bacterium]